MDGATMLETERLRAALSAKDELIEKLKSELRILRRSHSPIQPQELMPNGQTFHFLGLPAELRNAVYELCLEKGKVFLRPRTKYDHRYVDFENYEKPEWQLLAVSQQIRNEVAKVLLSKNHFVLSYDNSARSMFIPTGLNIRKSKQAPIMVKLGGLVSRHLCSASVTIDLRSIVQDPLEFASLLRDEGYGHPDGERHLESMTSGGRAQALHMELASHTGFWSHQCKAFANIKFLRVDITNCWCSLGCHRQIKAEAEAMYEGFFHGLPDVLEVLGAKTNIERSAISNSVWPATISGQSVRLSYGRKPTNRFKAVGADFQTENNCELYLHDCGRTEGIEHGEIDLYAVHQRKVSK